MSVKLVVVTGLWLLGFAISTARAAPQSFATADKAPTAVVTGDELAISDVLSKYREKTSMEKFKRALTDRVAAQKAGDARRFPGPWVFAVSGEKELEQHGAAKLEMKAKKRIALGIDPDVIARRYQFEAEADLLSKQQQTRGQEFEIAKLYTKLRQRQQEVMVMSATLSLLLPLEKQASAAVQIGTLGGFFATRLTLSVKRVRSDLLHARHAYALQARALAGMTGADIPENPLAITLTASQGSTIQISSQQTEQAYLVVAAGRARQAALSARATQLAGSWDIEAGIGISHHVESKAKSILFEVDIPLGTAAAVQSEITTLAAEQALLGVEGEMALARAKDQISLIKSNAERLVNALEIEKASISDLEALLAKAQGAFRTGQGEIGEVMETVKELHEAKIKHTDLQSELEEALLALTYFVQGDAQ